jgi:formylglycine-generating enzyme required for sulfatase activity
VVNITWHQATAYTEWLGKRAKQTCRLPTEAEWEYAARAGSDKAYPWGDDVGQNRANCHGCGSRWDHDQSAPVGSFPANAFGLYDTSGNVWEWTCSVWRDEFDGHEQQCADKEDTAPRVVRGGSWINRPAGGRSAARGDFGDPEAAYNDIGFRVWCSSLSFP